VKKPRKLELAAQTIRVLGHRDLKPANGGDGDPQIKTFRTVCFSVCASNPCV
jgi:hypothetical protein